MAKKTPAGEYLSISVQAAKAAAEAVTAADHAAQAGDVQGAQAAAKRAAEESTIAEQAWEKLENYRKGIATEAIGKALINRDAAADNARIAKDFVKTARRIAKKNEKAESAVFDQMADAPEETPEAAEALEGEILEPEHVHAPGMPPALDLAGMTIPDASGLTGFAEIDTEAVTVDYVAEAQKNAEAAELHANSAKSYAEDGNASGARTSAMLAHAAAKRARNFAEAAWAEKSDDADDAEDAQGYADMAAEYAEAAKVHRQTAEDVETARRTPRPDPVVTEALAEIDTEAPQAAPETPETPEDVPEGAEAVPDAQADAEAPEDARAAYVRGVVDSFPPMTAEQIAKVAALLGGPARPAGVHAERIGPRHTFRQLRPEPKSQPVQTAADADAWEARAAEIAAVAIGEQGTLFAEPAEIISRLAETAKDKAAAAIHWAGLGRLADAIVLAERAAEAARLATLTAADHEPDAGALDALARPARGWAASAAKAVDKAAG